MEVRSYSTHFSTDGKPKMKDVGEFSGKIILNYNLILCVSMISSFKKRPEKRSCAIRKTIKGNLLRYFTGEGRGDIAANLGLQCFYAGEGDFRAQKAAKLYHEVFAIQISLPIREMHL